MPSDVPRKHRIQECMNLSHLLGYTFFSPFFNSHCKDHGPKRVYCFVCLVILQEKGGEGFFGNI